MKPRLHPTPARLAAAATAAALAASTAPGISLAATAMGADPVAPTTTITYDGFSLLPDHGHAGTEVDLRFTCSPGDSVDLAMRRNGTVIETRRYDLAPTQADGFVSMTVPSEAVPSDSLVFTMACASGQSRTESYAVIDTEVFDATPRSGPRSQDVQVSGFCHTGSTATVSFGMADGGGPGATTTTDTTVVTAPASPRFWTHLALPAGYPELNQAWIRVWCDGRAIGSLPFAVEPDALDSVRMSPTSGALPAEVTVTGSCMFIGETVAVSISDEPGSAPEVLPPVAANPGFSVTLTIPTAMVTWAPTVWISVTCAGRSLGGVTFTITGTGSTEPVTVVNSGAVEATPTLTG